MTPCATNSRARARQTPAGTFNNPTQTPSGWEFNASFECCARGIKGDMDCDGTVGFADINVFVSALADPAGYEAVHVWCALENGDINNDGATDFGDINALVALLTGV